MVSGAVTMPVGMASDSEKSVREGINFGGTWNGRTFDIKGFDSDEAVEIPLGNTGELSGQCANGIA